MRLDARLFQQLAAQAACLVTVQSTRGSVPRDAGTWMAVFEGDVVGTIGGGQLEFQAIQQARQILKGFEPKGTEPAASTVVRYALGPNLGQCCGGDMHLEFARVMADDIAHLRLRLQPTLRPVALFGGGHVGKALVQVLGGLPVFTVWIDSRDEIFPADVPDNVICEHSDPVQAAVAPLLPGAMVLIMSFSHAQDLDVVAACLQRQRIRGDLPFIGLIGSQTKWATFRRRLVARGFSEAELASVTCPIGTVGITSKVPEVIAVSVAAQILQMMDQRAEQTVYTSATEPPHSEAG